MICKHTYKEEGKSLFPKLEKDSLMLRRALQEHQTIYSLISGIRSNKLDIHLLNEFAIAPDKHIRFEERELFNRLQSKVSDSEMIGLTGKHKQTVCDISENWNDKFWNFKK